MKKNLLASILFITSVFPTNAQELSFSLKWGKELEASRRSSLNDVVGHDATGIYTVKGEVNAFGRNAEYTLEHYDKNFALTKSFDLNLESGDLKGEVNNILHIKNRLYMFYSYSDKKTKKNTLFVKEIDKASLKPKTETKEIGEIDFTGKRKKNSGSFFYRVSRDSSKILVVYSLPYDEDQPAKFGFHVLDHQLNSIWEKQVTLPYQDELFDIKSFRIDNIGNAYLLGLVYKEKRKDKRRGLPNYSYEVIACRDKGSTLVQYPVALKKRFITDMQIEILDNQNIICAGFYSEIGKMSIGGTYFISIDAATKEIKTESLRDFGIDFITQNLSERQERKAKRKEEQGNQVELYEYDLDKLLVGKDGSAILVGEQYFFNVVTSTRMINGVMSMYTTTHYYYNDIIAVKIDPNGEIEWTQKIPKTQHTLEDGGFYSSYALAIVKGKICFIFNDNPKNIGVKESKSANYRPTKSVGVIVSLDQKGNVTKQAIFGSADSEVIMRPKVCEQISNQEVILFGQRKKNQQFAILTFN
jgi:hypothetical protein